MEHDRDLEETIAQFRRDAPRMAGIYDLIHRDFAPEPPVDDFTVRRVRQQVDTLLGAMWHGCIVLIDEFFEDLDLLNDENHDPDFLWIRGGLPTQFAHLYGIRFMRRFLLTTTAVTSRLATEWTVPGNVAEELGLRLVLDKMEIAEDTYGLDLPDGWRSDLEDLLYEDLDHDFLYSDVPPAAIADQIGMYSLDFTDWFVPFGDASAKIPYVQSGVPDATED